MNLMSIYPALFGLLAIAIFLIFYPLNEAKVAQMAKDLEARRAAENASASA